MGKFVVRVTEMLTRTVVVQAENSQEAKRKVMEEYYDYETVVLTADNSDVDTAFTDDTKNYSKEDLDKMPVEVEGDT